jgi:hypothetical protein
MNPQNMVLNLEKLEKTLLTNWIEFLNIRELRDTIKNTLISKLGYVPNCRVKKFSISRFELIENGFLIWIETTVTNDSSNIQSEKTQNNITMEFLLTKDDFIFLNHI